MKKPTKFIALTAALLMATTALAACGKPKDGNASPTESPAAMEGEGTPSTEPTAAPTDAHKGDGEHEGEDPAKISIGRVGTVEYTLQDYLDIFKTCEAYAESVPNLNKMIKDQLIEIGVIKTRCEQLGLTLDEEDEQQVRKLLDEELENILNMMTIDSSLTDEEEIRAARMEAMTELLKASGYTYESYVAETEKNIREYLLNQKLRDLIAVDVEMDDEQVQEYFNEQLEFEMGQYESDAEAFANAFSSYISGQGSAPLYTPEGMFTVKHLLIQFENFEDVTEEVEGVFGEEQNEKIDAVRAALESGITLESFIENYVSNEEYNNDKVFCQSDGDDSNAPYAAYANACRERGYIMNEQLLHMYYDGFGAAACVLYHGEDWVIPDGGDSGDSSEKPIESYGIKLYETTDGHRIAEVQSNCFGGGIHFIFISEELESGEAKMDLGNENDPVYSSMAEALKQELVDKRFEECFEQWKQETSVELDDEFIDSYAAETLGIS